MLSGGAIPDVPDGKVLVIQNVSGTCTVPDAAPFSFVAIGVGSNRTHIPMLKQGTNTAYNYLAGNQPVTFYVAAGQKPAIVAAYYFAYGASGNCSLNYHGYLESVQ